MPLITTHMKFDLKKEIIAIEQDMRNPKYLRVVSMEEYSALSREERETKFGFFRYPYSLSIDDWKMFREFISETYPIQYFFREVLRTSYYRLSWKISRLVDNVWQRFFSHQAWIIRKIALGNLNNDEIARNVLFEIVTQVVDSGELDMYEMDADLLADARACYEYIKIGRPTLELQLEKCTLQPQSDQLFDKMRNLETEIVTLDDKWMQWIAKNVRELGI